MLYKMAKNNLENLQKFNRFCWTDGEAGLLLICVCVPSMESIGSVSNLNTNKLGIFSLDDIQKQAQKKKLMDTSEDLRSYLSILQEHAALSERPVTRCFISLALTKTFDKPFISSFCEFKRQNRQDNF